MEVVKFFELLLLCNIDTAAVRKPFYPIYEHLEADWLGFIKFSTCGVGTTGLHKIRFSATHILRILGRPIAQLENFLFCINHFCQFLLYLEKHS